MNEWIGLGRLTKDPQIRTYGENNDKKMARFNLACDRRGKREEGQQTADFIPCVCYGKSADFADSYLRQGTKIAVTGSIVTGSYENKDGQKIYTTDILVRSMEFAESKKAASEQQPKPAQAAIPSAGDTDTGFLNIPDGLEEDLPFN